MGYKFKIGDGVILLKGVIGYGIPDYCVGMIGNIVDSASFRVWEVKIDKICTYLVREEDMKHVKKLKYVGIEGL
jgi:hypothetical protein